MSATRETPDFAVREIEVTSPRLRDGLRWTFQQIGGEGSYLLEDPLGGRFYRLGRREYEFAKRLDGRQTVSDLVATSARGDSGAALEAGEATSLVRMLIDAGLVTTEDSDHAERVWDEVNRKQESKRTLGKMGQIMFLKLPLGNPDRFFAAVAVKMSWLTGPIFAFVWLVTLIWGAVAIFGEKERFAAQMSGLFDFGNLWILGGLWLVLKVIHECWHGLVCRRFGGVVPEAGVTLLLLTTPLGYVNASSSTAFASKWQRIAVSAAGIYGELFIAALAAILWSKVDPGALSGGLHQVVVLSSITTLLFNANPLMRFDGYYILSDLLDIPNLFTKGQKVSKWIFRRWILGMKKAKYPLAKSERIGVITVYGIAASVWKVIIITGLIITAAFLFEGAGLLLAAFVICIMIVQGIAGTVEYLKKSALAEGLQPVRLVLRVATGLGLITAALFLIKVTPTSKAPAVVQDVRGGAVRVDCPGLLTELFVTDSEQVKEGDLLARLENIEEISRLRRLETDIAGSRLRRDQFVEDGEIAAAQAEAENLAALEGIAKDLRVYTASLELRAPRDGIVDGRHLELLLGTWIEPGRLLLSVAAEDTKELIILAAAGDRENFEDSRRANREVVFQPRGRLQTWTAALRDTVPRASLEPPHFALITAGEGPLPVKQRGTEPEPSARGDSSAASSRYELTKPRFEIRADLAGEGSASLRDGEMGMVLSRATGSNSLAELGMRRLQRQFDRIVEQHMAQ